MDGREQPVLLREGETCWRTARADRVSFLIDGETYFSAVADALERARHRVWLLGWDFHSGVRLRRGGDSKRPAELVALLDSLVRERRSLHVHVLAWDFAMLYALEREFLPLLQFGARTHPRIHFATDAAHPTAGCQHQKLVVVDDSIAFTGGFDLTAHRWDTREHLPEDPRRVTPSGKPYAPFHDVQIAVGGEAAAALAAMARERWGRATRNNRVDASPQRADSWPSSLEPDLQDVDVGIARTLPSHRGEPEVREIEVLYRESIAAARRWVYVENQYLTSARLAGFLAERLREHDGPEIVIVGPRGNSGWLEENTMGALRDRAVRALREADRHDRLLVVYPHRADLPDDEMINVHSKVMVIDDAFVRVGSSNLSNRSLGVDSECDVAIVSCGERRVADAIAAFRNDLLAEHLGTSADEVAAHLARTGSLVKTVRELQGGPRSLESLEIEASDWAAEAVEALGAIDPEHPAPLEELVARFEADEHPARRAGGQSLSGLAIVLVVIVGVALVWQLTPLGAWVSAERLSSVLAFARETWHGPIVAALAFTLASLLLVPVTALTVAAGLALGPWIGFAVAWTGCTASAALGYLGGRILWREPVRRLAGERLAALSRRLARRGVLSSALLRVVPIAPFMVVNLVAGASHVRARDFVIGTALGIAPGAIVLVLAADGVREWVARPGGPEWLWVALAALALMGVIGAARRLVRSARRAAPD